VKNPVPINNNGMIIRKPKPMTATAVRVNCRLLSVAVFGVITTKMFGYYKGCHIAG